MADEFLVKLGEKVSRETLISWLCDYVNDSGIKSTFEARKLLIVGDDYEVTFDTHIRLDFSYGGKTYTETGSEYEYTYPCLSRYIVEDLMEAGIGLEIYKNNYED